MKEPAHESGGRGAVESAELAPLKPPAQHGLARQVGLHSVMSRVFGREAPGFTLGRYCVHSKLGEGGMGVVYRGSELQTGHPVAIKMLTDSAGTLRQRFRREAAVLQQLRHPRIVRYLDHGTTEDDQDYLVMEWLEGQDLATRLEAGALSVADTLRLASAVATGLVSAHSAGIVHRDIKPRNLYLIGGAIEELKVIDFGVAAHSASRDGLTATGNVLGTPAYMAPEQIRGKSSVRTDVYGLGATLFECLSGRPPFVAESAAATLLSVASEPAPRLGELTEGIPPELELLVQRMLAKDPEARPISMSALLTELEGIAEHAVPRRRPLEILSPHEKADEVAPLSAGPTSVRDHWFGRARELALLHGLHQETIDERRASLCTVSGDAGIGKTRLIRALISLIGPGRATVMQVTCRREATGLPFAALLGLLSSLDPTRLGRPELAGPLRHLEQLTGMIATGEVAALAAGATRGADQVRLAWLDLIESLGARAPLVIAIDDAEHVDLASFRLVEGAARVLSGQSSLVILAGRLSDTLELLARTWRAAPAVKLALDSLGPRALLHLARAWSPRSPEEELRTVALRSAGNPGQLRALLRLQSGAREASDRIERDARARFAALNDESRRLVRGAAMFGARFWASPLARLLGAEPASLAPRLELLSARGYFAPEEDSAEPSYVWQDELLRVAAVESCTEEDTRLANRVIGHWLTQQGRGLPLQIARHFKQAAEPTLALEYYVRAARAALSGEDDAQLEQLMEEARACEGDATLSAELSVAAAEAAFWRGELKRAATEAERATTLLPPGSGAWYRALSLQVSSLGQAGENDAIARLEPRIFDVAALPEAREAQLACASRLLTQLAAANVQQGRAIARRVEQLTEQHRPGPESRAWVERGRVLLNQGSDIDGTIAAWVAAHADHVAARDPRSAAQVQIYLGSLYTWTGAWERAREALDSALRTAERLGSDYLQIWARYTEAKLLTETAPFEETARQLGRVIERSADSPRIQNGARAYLALAALRAGLFAQAAEAARACEQAGGSVVPRLGALAVRTLAALDCNNPELAAAAGAELERLSAGLERLVEFEALVQLSRAALAHARGVPIETATRSALERLERDARTIGDPLARSRFWERPYAHRRVRELAGLRQAPLLGTTSS